MAQSGNWFFNLYDWYIGYYISVLWFYVGYILSIFGMWQISHDGVAGVLELFKPSDNTGSSYTTAFTLGN